MKITCIRRYIVTLLLFATGVIFGLPLSQTAMAAMAPPDERHYCDIAPIENESNIGVISETLTFNFPPFNESDAANNVLLSI